LALAVVVEQEVIAAQSLASRQVVAHLQNQH
jgi:hypothetical protein